MAAMPARTRPAQETTAKSDATPSAASGVTAMVVATLLWGGTFVVLRDALHGLSPVAVVFARFAIAGVIFALLALLRRARLTRTILVAGVLSGVGFGALYLLQAIGLTRISAGSSAFLTCAGSLFTGLIAWPLLGQRPGGALVFGMLIALVGAALLSLDSRLALGAGELMTLAGALGYSIGLIVVGRLGGDYDPVLLAAIQSLATAACLAAFASRALGEFTRLPAANAWRFAYLVLAGSLIAPWLQLVAQRALPPGRIGLLLALEPVFALAFAVTVGKESFVARWWIGAALILCAVAVVETESARRSATARSAA